MTHINRRQAIQRSAGIAAPMFVPAAVLGRESVPSANERIGIGAIGVGGRARLLLEQLPEAGRVVALCDCNLPRADAFKAEKHGAWPVYQDHRELLDRGDVDAVIVGTGEFQRVSPCIEACLAGKDIYAEKPLTLYIREGRVLVDAVRRHARVFQVGTQQRSMQINRLACELVRSGRLGKVLSVQAMNYPGAEVAPSLPFADEAIPRGLNWDRWLNQASMRSYSSRWMSWMRWRDFAGGEMTNWGAHGVDQIQWALGTDNTGPLEAWPIDRESGKVGMRYANGVELNFVLDRGPMGGAVFVCERGKLEVNRNKVTSNPPDIAEELLSNVDITEEERKWSDKTALWQARWHMQDWLECIKTRERPVAGVEIGHRSATVCHLANITRQLGKRITWDPEAERIVNNNEAAALVDRPRRKEYELPT